MHRLACMQIDVQCVVIYGNFTQSHHLSLCYRCTTDLHSKQKSLADLWVIRTVRMGIPPSVNTIKTPLVYIAGIKEHLNKALVTDFLQRMIKGFRIGYKEHAKKAQDYITLLHSCRNGGSRRTIITQGSWSLFTQWMPICEYQPTIKETLLCCADQDNRSARIFALNEGQMGDMYQYKWHFIPCLLGGWEALFISTLASKVPFQVVDCTAYCYLR